MRESVTVEEATKALTTGEIARRLDQPVHRIEYVIRTRKIRAVARAGNARVFVEADMKRIAGEIKRMEEKKA